MKVKNERDKLGTKTPLWLLSFSKTPRGSILETQQIRRGKEIKARVLTKARCLVPCPRYAVPKSFTLKVKVNQKERSQPPGGMQERLPSRWAKEERRKKSRKTKQNDTKPCPWETVTTDRSHVHLQTRLSVSRWSRGSNYDSVLGGSSILHLTETNISNLDGGTFISVQSLNNSKCTRKQNSKVWA